jgi:hypothetical protein
VATGTHEGPKLMLAVWLRMGITSAAYCALMVGVSVHGAPAEEREALLVQIVHPERQAAEVLRLFEGARAPHPAAALAGWKRATHEPMQLGKPLEAVIALFNPEMIPEWRIMHATEVGFGIRAVDGKPRFYAIVPHDDGTLAAVITADRLSGGPVEPPLVEDGKTFAVERLGTSGSIVATQLGSAVIVAGSRDDLKMAQRRLAFRVVSGQGAALAPAEEPGDSALRFDFDPALLETPGADHLTLRRVITLLRALDWGTFHGSLALRDDRLDIGTSSHEKSGVRTSRATAPAAVEPAWLRWVPAATTLGLISLATPSDAAFWDSVFALADRVDRADPAHAETAPLRSRINLFAAGAGARLEADLWPHLRGITVALAGDQAAPAAVNGALLVLHLDSELNARRVATDIVPRLVALSRGKKPAAAQFVKGPPGATIELGPLSGRSLVVADRGRDVLLGWGQGVLEAALDADTKPERSALAACAGWAKAGKPAPQRVGAVWPARCWSPAVGGDRTTLAWNALAEGPPAVWWGWDEPSASHDSVSWSGLRGLVHRFLDHVPLDPSPLP